MKQSRSIRLALSAVSCMRRKSVEDEFGVYNNDLVCFQYKVRDGEVEWILSRSVLRECAVAPLEVVGVAGLRAGILKCGGWKALSACKQTSSSIATVSDPGFGLDFTSD